MAWTYQREKNTYETKIPEGNHRIRVKAANKAVSSKGNDMLVLQFDVSGYAETVYHYITFMPDHPEITNKNLTQFFDAFKDIPDGELDTSKWIGKVGACCIKHSDYNDNINAKIAWFVSASKQDSLPPWKEVDSVMPAAPAMNADADGFVKIPEGINDLPF